MKQQDSVGKQTEIDVYEKHMLDSCYSDTTNSLKRLRFGQSVYSKSQMKDIQTQNQPTLLPTDKKLAR